MTTHKLSLTENQWDLLFITLLDEAECLIKGSSTADKDVGRKITAIINKLIDYRKNTNQ